MRQTFYRRCIVTIPYIVVPRKLIIEESVSPTGFDKKKNLGKLIGIKIHGLFSHILHILVHIKAMIAD